MTKKLNSTPNNALRDYFADNERFADVFNTYLFGKTVLNPSDLSPLDTVYTKSI